MKCLFFSLALTLVSVSVFSQSLHGGGLLMDDASYTQAPLKSSDPIFTAKLARRVSLKGYAPTPKNQFQYNNCVAWATAYAAYTIQEARQYGWKQQEEIDKHAFAPGFVYKLISRDQSCYTPVAIDRALEAMRRRGNVMFRETADQCISGVSREMLSKASRHRIKGYQRIFHLTAPAKDKLVAIRFSLAEGKPVVFGMKCPPSFERAEKTTLWQPRESPNHPKIFGHAMCIVGYDDEKYGGAFEIMNSWGTEWGNGGFIWIRYADFARFAKYGYELLPHSKPLASE